MSFEDVAMIVDGNVLDDETEFKPFTKNFAQETILVGLWSKVGFVPFTRCCVKNNQKVRHELGQQERDETLEALQ